MLNHDIILSAGKHTYIHKKTRLTMSCQVPSISEIVPESTKLVNGNRWSKEANYNNMESAVMNSPAATLLTSSYMTLTFFGCWLMSFVSCCSILRLSVCTQNFKRKKKNGNSVCQQISRKCCQMTKRTNNNEKYVYKIDVACNIQ